MRIRQETIRRHHSRGRFVFRRRKGATVVEFAMVAPVVFLFVLGAVMFDGVLMTQNTLTAAAREGGRVASLPHVASGETVVNAVEERLRQGGADPELATIVVDPPALGGLISGSEVTVTVSMPLSQSTWLPFGNFLTDGDLVAQMTHLRE